MSKEDYTKPPYGPFIKGKHPPVRTPYDPVELAIKEQCDMLAELLIKKRRDYGVQNMKKHGHFGVLVRIDDKVSRLNSLYNSAETHFESISDTFLDLAGYAIIGKLMEENRYE